MAQWRLDNLDWLEKTERDLYPLLDKETPASDLQPAFLRTDKPAAAPQAPTQSTQQAANQIAPPAAVAR
jgi:hypothetical protein